MSLSLAFKQEAIQGMVMATYTKIFLQFPHKFWFSTEVVFLYYLYFYLTKIFNNSLQMALYADSDRGRYPIWQSLDHPNFFHGSRIIFVTITVSYIYISNRHIREDERPLTCQKNC